MIPTLRALPLVAALYACLLASDAWSEPLQTVAVADNVVALPSATFAVELIYSTSDADASLPGLRLRIHFDATELTWVQNTYVNDQDLIGVSAPSPDTEDFDNSPATDTFIQFAWASINSSWPGQIPATLANLEFSARADFTGTTLNLTAGDTATGYSFQSAPIQVPLSTFNWDIDDDGEALALTDGLMMIRHMFGFGGESLSAGVMGAGAGRATPDAISSHLTGANAELDVDGDGESMALTDGLLLIRYLFGFSGDSLISGVIGNGAERDTAEEVEAYIEARLPASP